MHLPPATLEYHLDREINPRLSFKEGRDPNLRIASGVDPLLAAQQAVPESSSRAFSTLLVDIAGQGYSGVNPPDTVGEVGPNHYVQMINGSGGAVVRIYNKSGGTVGNQFAVNSLGTGACSTGYGDPIALYDTLAGRWLLSEFGQTGNHLCVYVSLTDDPTGSYYAYDFTTPNFPDYPKYAVWPDAYYVTTNETGAPAVYAWTARRCSTASQPPSSASLARDWPASASSPSRRPTWTAARPRRPARRASSCVTWTPRRTAPATAPRTSWSCGR